MSHDNANASAAVGTWVKVVEHSSGDEEVFYIVEPRETDYLDNKLSPDNPMGCALLGAKPGQEVAIDGPNGTVRFSVLEVGR
jgi:transcription elongation GreA/GreB family factor